MVWSLDVPLRKFGDLDPHHPHHLRHPDPALGKEAVHVVVLEAVKVAHGGEGILQFIYLIEDFHVNLATCDDAADGGVL